MPWRRWRAFHTTWRLGDGRRGQFALAVAWMLAVLGGGGCTISLPAQEAGAYLAASADGSGADGCGDGLSASTCSDANAGNSCTGKADGAPCTDDNPMTSGETCAGGSCSGGAPFCDFLVTSLADGPVGTCTAASCTLRDAVTAALDSTATQAPVIAFALAGTIQLAGPLPAIHRSLTLDGAAGTSPGGTTPRVAIDGGGTMRLLQHQGGVLTLRALSLRNGAADHGAAVKGDAAKTTGLVVEDCSFVDNIAQNTGGAIASTAPAVLRRSTFTGNRVVLTHAFALGGAAVFYGKTEVEDCWFSGNKSGNYGGAIAAATGSALTIRRSAFTDNQAVNGGGLVSFTQCTLVNVTLVGNGGPTCAEGGGIDAGGTATLTHVTLADNTCQTTPQLHMGTGELVNCLISGKGPGAQCQAASAKSVGNFVSDGSCGALTSGDAALGPVGNHGGFAPSVKLLAGSPAVDAGVPAGCGAGTAAATDQRGVARPQGIGCDCGAYEVGPNDCPAGRVAVGNRCVDPASGLFRIGESETTLSSKVDLFFAAPGNLLVNGGAEAGSYAPWQVINGGKGWTLDGGLFGTYSFTGSWLISWLLQEVDLAASGISNAAIDNGTAPPLLAGLTALGKGQPGSHHKPGTEDQVTLRIAPIDALGKTGPDLVFQVMDCPYGVMGGLHLRLASLPKGTRKLLVAVGSVDTEHAPEHFAAATDGIYLAPGDLQLRLANEEEPFGQWQPYAGVVKGWQLKPGAGKRQVRAEFRDALTQVPLGGGTDTIQAL